MIFVILNQLKVIKFAPLLPHRYCSMSSLFGLRLNSVNLKVEQFEIKFQEQANFNYHFTLCCLIANELRFNY